MARANSTEAQVRIDLAAAYRLSAQRGWDDTIYTHLSASVPGAPGRYLINPYGARFDEITASSLVPVDTQGRVVDGSGPSTRPASPSTARCTRRGPMQPA